MDKNKYFTVIIPTLWKCFRLNQTLQELNDCRFVGEIILIDNTSNNKPIKGLNKLNHILEGHNTYVTAPFNKGVKIAQYDKLLILNDDTWFDWNILEILSDYVNPQTGMIGISKEGYYIDETKNLSLIPITHRPLAYACAFFIHKESWIPIPEEFKIYCNDDWLFVKNRQANKTNYVIDGFKINGWISLTSDDSTLAPEIESIKNNDLQLKIKYELF
jgi:hypothetical protein